MSMNYQQTVADRVKRFLKERSALNRLLLINIIVWLTIYLVRIVAYLFQNTSNPLEQKWLLDIQDWLAVPANLDLLIARPWTIISYMFLHVDFWHLFFNMLWLYWFGKIFLEFQNSRKLWLVYLVGGISGALVFMLAFNTFPVFELSRDNAVALGASASILAVVVATAMLVPDYIVNLMFIGQVKIKYIALFTIVLDVLMIRSGNAGGHFAHLGGAISGAVYILLVRSSYLKPKIKLGRIKSLWNRKTVKKAFSNTAKPLTDEEYNARRAESQKKIDAILDKIAKSGYKSLSNEEKELLFRFSKK